MEPVDVIKLQLEAYNSRNLESFMNLIDPNAVAFDLKSGEKIIEGKEEMKARYKDRFDNSPNLFSNLLGRISLANIVIDDEDISGFGGNNNVRIIAIYEVKSNLITRMWFIRGDENSEVVRPVDLQLKGYNSGDINLFLTAYHNDCELYDLQSGELRMKGLDAMRERYGNLFQSSPNLEAKIVKRFYLDNYVIDYEHVSGFQGNQNIKAIAINEVIDGLITKVWFCR